MVGLIALRLPWCGRTAVARLAALCVLALAGAFGTAVAGDADVLTVRVQTLPRSWTAYGQIAPTAILAVRSVDPGTLRGLHVVPGGAVAAGDVLAQVGGPRVQSLLTAREEALRSARAQQSAARRALAIVRREWTNQLATRQAVDTAQRDWQVARAAVRTAAAQLGAARALRIVRAPVAGTVIAFQAADGEEMSAGETILTLMPAGRLWIGAAYYGADAAALHAGMTGRFRPADGGEAIAVRVVAVASGIAADGSRTVGLLPTSSALPAWWENGQWGTVAIDGPPRRMAAVPTSALILDHGHWWVLVRTAQGDRAQEVTPGPTRGWQTWIASGLQPGQRIVVRDAFLEYHRGIAESFQPPD